MHSESIVRDVKAINVALCSQYGCFGTLKDRPRFKLIWSDEEYELRHGNFDIVYNGIYLRTEENVTKLVPKYSYIKERWILEKFFPPPGKLSKELPLAWKGTYEPIYVFDTNGVALIPRLDVCQVVIYAIDHPWERHKIAAMMQDQIIKQAEEEVNKMRELIQGNESSLTDSLHYGDAIPNALDSGAKPNIVEEKCKTTNHKPQ
jgi:hypothetical protein